MEKKTIKGTIESIRIMGNPRKAYFSVGGRLVAATEGPRVDKRLFTAPSGTEVIVEGDVKHIPYTNTVGIQRIMTQIEATMVALPNCLRICIDFEAWESAAEPINTEKVDMLQAETDLHVIMTRQHGYSPAKISAYMRNGEQEEGWQRFNEILCKEEESVILANGGKYYNESKN